MRSTAHAAANSRSQQSAAALALPQYIVQEGQTCSAATSSTPADYSLHATVGSTAVRSMGVWSLVCSKSSGAVLLQEDVEYRRQGETDK